MKLRSLFVAAAAALLLTAAFVPRANATLLVYFNFEDGTLDSTVDTASDQTPANPGGGIQASTLMINYGAGDFFSTSSAIPIGTTNQSAGDTDVPPATPGLALGLTRSSKVGNQGGWIQFAVNATFFKDMSLSYAVNTNGNGFKTQTLFYSLDGGATFIQDGQFNNLTGLQTLTYTVPTVANGDPGLVLRIVFTNGSSNGNDLQTIIDNIQLNGTVIPEPATVAGGALAAIGLGWYQRRRLICLLRLRRA